MSHRPTALLVRRLRSHPLSCWQYRCVLWFVGVSVLTCCEPPQQPSLAGPTSGATEESATEPSVGGRLVVFKGPQSPAVTHYNGATGEFFTPEIMGSGGALFDYDNDGDLDLYVIQGARLVSADTDPADAPRNHLFRNDLDGSTNTGLRFTEVTAKSGLGDAGYGMGCAVADYDGDGHRDVYVTNYGPNQLYRNRGDGTFESTGQAPAPGFSASAAFLDYDNDGDLDLFVTTYLEFSVGATRECRRLGGQDDYCGPRSYEARPDHLYRNDGDGNFTEVSKAAGIYGKSAYGLGVVSGDYNNDGWMDLFVANDATPNHLWLNGKDGVFHESALLAGVAVNQNGENEAGMGVTLGDFDGDGDGDLLLTHENGETNTLYTRTGNGEFLDQTTRSGLGHPSLPYAGFGTGWLDFDLDGDLDLFVTNGAVRALPEQVGERHPYRQPDQLFENRNQRFREISSAAGLSTLRREAGRGACFGDLDNDGDVDIVVTNNRGPLRILLSEPPSGNAWAQLLLEGRSPNRDAYGARIQVQLQSGGRRHFRVGTDGSYLSVSSRRITVGLGQADRVVAVLLEWPSGLRESFSTVPTGQLTRLIEGEGSSR